MTYAQPRSGINQYNQVGNHSSAACASPHRLIQMLMEGALEKISQAKGFIERGEVAKKGEYISWAISIIDGLRVSLDHESGGEVSQNLESLYDYMMSRLAEANIQSSTEILDEVGKLLLTVKAGWDAIPQDVIEEHADKQQVHSARLTSEKI